jgi:Na+-transporting methylmalonyl-CoA/oxaloacetate decarboxylase gamma subunit
VNDPILVALMISAVGLSLLFGALFLLYGLMMALTAVARDRDPAPDPPASELASRSPESGDRDRRAQVAVIAVALARVERERGAAPAPAPTGGWSPWRAFHAHRLLGRRGERREG